MSITSSEIEDVIKKGLRTKVNQGSVQHIAVFY